MAVCRGLVILVEAVRIDQRDRRGAFGRTLVMVDHDHIYARVARRSQSLVRHRAAIDGHDEAGAFLTQLDQRFAARAVTFEQAVGNVVASLVTQHPEQANHQCSRGRPVDVVVSVDRHGLTSENGLRQSFRGHFHVLEDRRIGQEGRQLGIALTLQIVTRNTTREQDLREDIIAQTRGAVRELIATAAPAPATPGK